MRRHGSARGAGGAGGADGLELLERPVQLALLGQQPRPARRAARQHLDVQRGVDQPVLGQRAAGPVGGAVPLLQRQAEQLLDERAEPDPGEPGQPAGQLGVEQPRRGAAPPRRGRQVLGGGVQHPLRAGQRRGELGQVAAERDRVDQRGAGARAAQLHQIGPLRVAEAGRALGVDGDRPAAAAANASAVRASAARSATTRAAARRPAAAAVPAPGRVGGSLGAVEDASPVSG